MRMHLGDVVTMVVEDRPSIRPAAQKDTPTRVAVLVLVGHEPRDGTAPLDVEAAMRRLGWRRDA